MNLQPISPFWLLPAVLLLILAVAYLSDRRDRSSGRSVNLDGRKIRYSRDDVRHHLATGRLMHPKSGRDDRREE